MASAAPFIGLNAPLKYHCLALDIFGALSKPSHLHCNKETALEQSSLAREIMKFKAWVRYQYCSL